MIKVEAVVRPEKVNQVLNAFQEAGCGGFHYGIVTGQGKQQGVEVFTGRGGQLVNRAAMPKTVITTVISDDKKDAVINAILEILISLLYKNNKYSINKLQTFFNIKYCFSIPHAFHARW